MPYYYIFSRVERFYLQEQALFNVINNVSGVATLGNTNACRGINFTMNNTVATLTRRDKTGSRTVAQGTRGRGYAKGTLEASLVSSGAVGVVPPLDPLFQNIFGAGAVNAGVNVQYTLADPLLYMTLWSFRTTTGLTAADQRAIGGVTITEATFNLGQDIAEFSATCEGKWMVRSAGFASMNADEQMGLTTFPAEPSAPVLTDGGLVAGFTGALTIGGQVVTTNVVSAQIMVRTGSEVVKNNFGLYTPNTGEADERNIGMSFSIYEDDSPAMETLKEAAELKTPVNATIVIGTIPGSIFTFQVNGLLLGDCDFNNNSQRRAVLNFAEGRAAGTAPGAHDELIMTIT